MAIDTSIYQNIQAPQMPSYADSQQKAFALSQMQMQQAQMQRQMMQQMAVRQAYANNVDANGNLDQKGFLSQYAKIDPMGAVGMQKQMGEANEATAKAGSAASDDYQHRANLVATALQWAKGQPDQEAAYNTIKGNLEGTGIAKPGQLPAYSPDVFDDLHTKALQYQGVNSKDFLANQETKAKTAKDFAEADKARSETPKPFVGKIDPATDPAQLVSQYVPKDLRPKVYEEIKTAQDIKALAPKIRDAFIMGSSRNPITAAQGQRMFEGLINTTVKDTEGTARQAAFDSIHKTMTPSGITAAPGENATKWATVEKYLNSKASAPISKGYGIDLTQFNSTAPYSATPQNSGGSGGFVPTAYADDGAKSQAPAAPVSKYRPGDIIAVKGKMYRVGSDGDSLLPTGGGK